MTDDIATKLTLGKKNSQQLLEQLKKKNSCMVVRYIRIQPDDVD